MEKKLVISFGKIQEEIVFSHPSSPNDIDEVFQLRHKIYTKYNYLNLKHFKNNREFDDYDTNGESIYFTAKIGGRILGLVRLIRSEQLPIEKFFEFGKPKEMAKVDRSRVAEIGRLVIDKYSDTLFLPRNMILLFLISCVTEYCEENSIYFVYSFIKKRLTEKMNLLGIPYTLIEPYKLTYPSDGPMAPYFFSTEDPVYPAYFELSQIREFVEKKIKNKMLFKEIGENHFILQHNLYTRFLKTVRVI